MNVHHFIRNSLVELDETKGVIRYLLENTYAKTTRTDRDTARTVFRFHDSGSDEFILETDVEILAVYYDKYGLWTWAWSMIGLYKSEYLLSRDALVYALGLGIDLAYIKAILTTSRGIISDTTQIDINLAIASAVTKKHYIYPYIITVDNNYLIYYFTLINVAELDALKKRLSEVKSKEYDETHDQGDIYDEKLLDLNAKLNKY